jgi:hypothetical protein
MKKCRTQTQEDDVTMRMKVGQHWCKAKTKAGGTCRAPAVERGLCFFHAHPEKLAELGRQGGSKNRHQRLVADDLQEKRFANVEDVRSLLEETVNHVRNGKLDCRLSNAIGFLAGMLLKALDQGQIERRLAELEAILGSRTGKQVDAFQFVSTTGDADEQS